MRLFLGKTDLNTCNSNSCIISKRNVTNTTATVKTACLRFGGAFNLFVPYLVPVNEKNSQDQI